MMESTTTTTTNSAFTVAFLDLPAGTTLTLNGIPLRLPLDKSPPAIVGFRSLPNGHFHWVTLRSSGSITQAFVVNHSFVRRYDPSIEEVMVTDTTTQTNVLATIQQAVENNNSNNTTLFLAAIPTFQMLLDKSKSPNKQQQWHDLTHFISLDWLSTRKMIDHQQSVKIVPGILQGTKEEEEKLSTSTTSRPIGKDTDDDGISVCYPPIPVFSPDHRASSHEGTKQFLRTLLPHQRTQFFRVENPNTLALEQFILPQSYGRDNNNLLADLQLSFLLFLHIHCYPSLVHWRNLTALLSHTTHHATTTVVADVLCSQISLLLETEEGSLQEYSDSHWISSLRTFGRVHAGLRHVLEQQHRWDDEEMDMTKGYDDDDGPVVVETAVTCPSSPLTPPPRWAAAYPILAAAQQEHEDVLMTCARALDEAVDVSLVREAAAYLETVESGV